MELADLYFGRDDAEMDIADGGLLRAGFLPTPAYKAARKARKHLIIGRKGSGKSAICRTLAAQEDPELVTRLVASRTTRSWTACWRSSGTAAIWSREQHWIGGYPRRARCSRSDSRNEPRR